MKYSRELSKSDLQAVKIRLGHFLGMFYVGQLRIKQLKFIVAVNGDSIFPDLLQWAMIYSFGINTDFANKSNLIPNNDL